MKQAITLILLAGGKGTRMNTCVPKQFLQIKDKPIAQYSLEVFLTFDCIREVILVCESEYRSLFSHFPIKFAPPGTRRQDSVENGFHASDKKSFWYCIHDAARPFIAMEAIEKLFEEGKTHEAATLAVPAKSTMRIEKANRIVDFTPPREKVWEIQTPQFLSKALLEEGLLLAHFSNITVTDDVSFAELLSRPIKLVLGSYSNIKITTPEDLIIAEQLVHEILVAKS